MGCRVDLSDCVRAVCSPAPNSPRNSKLAKLRSTNGDGKGFYGGTFTVMITACLYEPPGNVLLVKRHGWTQSHTSNLHRRSNYRTRCNVKPTPYFAGRTRAWSMASDRYPTANRRVSVGRCSPNRCRSTTRFRMAYATQHRSDFSTAVSITSRTMSPLWPAVVAAQLIASRSRHGPARTSHATARRCRTGTRSRPNTNAGCCAPRLPRCRVAAADGVAQDAAPSADHECS